MTITSTAVSLFVKGVEVDASIMNEIFAERHVDFFVRNTRYYSAEYLQQLESPMSARWTDMKYTGVRKSKEERGRCLQF